MTLKEIALELLERYRLAKEVIIDEFSPNEAADLADLKAEIEDYKKRFDEASAEDWIPFKLREMTEEERKEYPPEITGIWCEPLPDHGQDILVSDGKYVWDDTFYSDDYCYLDGGDDIKEGMAWMPKPKAYKPQEADK